MMMWLFKKITLGWRPVLPSNRFSVGYPFIEQTISNLFISYTFTLTFPCLLYIPIEVINGWSKLRPTDVVRAMLCASGESFFHQMRLGSQMAAAMRRDMRLRKK